MDSVIPWLVILVVTALIVTAVVVSGKRGTAKRQVALEAGLTAQAYALEAMAKAGFSESANIPLESGEKLIYQSHDIRLAEFKSGGSTYSGGSAGVSFPLFGRVRGNIGRQGGTFTRNPDQLTVIDSGKVIFTTRKVIFSGVQQTRTWDLSKLIDFDAGPNGLWVRISVSNSTHTSMLETLDQSVLSPGILLDLASTAQREGEASAMEKVNEYVRLLREAVASQHTGSKR